MFHALADPTRRAVVERLSRGPVSASELAKPFAISLPSVVQHLQVFKECGVIRSEKVRRVRTCHTEPRALRAPEQWIAEQRAVWERRLDRLDEYLRDPRAEETKDDDGD
jgi:DNA-binding transcriptional ArsR family regulator